MYAVPIDEDFLFSTSTTGQDILDSSLDFYSKRPETPSVHTNTSPPQGQEHFSVMGNSVSTVTPSAATAGIDSYVSELGDIHYEKRYMQLRIGHRQ